MGVDRKKESRVVCPLISNNMNEFLIRQLVAADVKMLTEISIATFTATYAAYNTAADMQLYISNHFNEALLKEELENDSNYFFGAFSGSEPAGYVKLSTSQKLAELTCYRNIELERIYAVSSFQGVGLGQQLMRYVLNFVVSRDFEVIWLGVWKENKKALNFYSKSGFIKFGEHTFILGEDVQLDWLLKKELQSLKIAPG